MTSKPTARERFEEISRLTNPDFEDTQFLIALVEAAVWVIEQDWDEQSWDKIDHRLAEV